MSNTKKMLILWIPLLLFAVLIYFFEKGLQRDPHAIPSALIGQELPKFTAENLLVGKPMIDRQQFFGHVTLLQVWASWCITCQMEHPVLLDIARANKVILYGLNYKDQRPAALSWLQQYGNPFTLTIYDPKGQLGMQLGVYGTPETFLIDSHGIIRDKYIGAISPEEWQETILPKVMQLHVS